MSSETQVLENDTQVLEALSLCRGVLQRYLAHVQGVAVEEMWPDGVDETNSIGFEYRGATLHLQLDLVENYYHFPIERAN